MHLKPAVGSPRPVGRAIVDHLFRSGESGRIPIVGVAGSPHLTTGVARLVAWLLHLSGRHVGLACTDGLFFDRRCAESGDCANWTSAHRLLMNRAVAAAVVENGAASILRDGLAYDRCAVGVVTDFEGAEQLAEFDVQGADQLHQVLRTQIDVVLPDGAAVLDAGDERVCALSGLCDGEVIFYAVDRDSPVVRAHRATGGRAVLLHQGRVLLAQGNGESPFGELGSLMFRHRSRSARAVRALLAGVAVAWALDIPRDLIVAGVETFDLELTLPLDPACTSAAEPDGMAA